MEEDKKEGRNRKRTTKCILTRQRKKNGRLGKRERRRKERRKTEVKFLNIFILF